MNAEEQLATIRAFVEMGLNSPNPHHWEAALRDILDVLDGVEI